MYFRISLFPGYICLVVCVFAIAGAGGSTAAEFKRIGPFGGDVRSLLIDLQQPEIAYLGTSNGMIFKSSDSGNSWKPLHPGIGRPEYVIDTLIQHPNEKDHIYAGAWDLHSEGGGLFESRDGGTSWSQTMLGQVSLAVRGLSICKSKPEYMIAGTLAGAYVTADGGKNWKRVGENELQKAESVAIDPVDHKILYVGTWRLGYKSSDFGKTWIRVDNGMPLDSDVFSIAIDYRNPSIVYSSACSGVYRSTNLARNWTRLRLLPDRFTVRAQAVYLDPLNPQRVYSGTTEGLFVSSNDGQNWTRLTANNVTVNAIQVNPQNNQRILIGTEYDGILLSENGGKTWRASNAGFIHKKISWIVPDPDNTGCFLAGLASGSGGFYFYDSRTGAWTHSQIEEGTRILSFLILPQNRGELAGTSQGAFWHANNSKPWVKLKGSIAKRAVYSLAVDPQNSVFYAGTDQGIYRTSQSAMDFRLPPNYRLSPQVWCINASSAGVVFAGSSLGLLRSWDRGTIWNAISSYGLPGRTPIGSIAVSPLDKEHLFAGTSVGLYESTNGGVYWRQVGGGRMGMKIPSVVFLDNSGKRILAADGNSSGVFYSKDGGQNWDQVSAEFESPATCIALDPGQPSRVFLGTQSDGIYLLDLP